MLAKMRRVALISGLMMACGTSYAEEKTLECKLYVAESMDHVSSYSVDSSGSIINGLRRGGICLFTDGSIADKQFVMGINSRQGGSVGDAVGISVYTFGSGDTLTLSFIGGWDKGPFSAQYTILRGTGAYEGASGGGTIRGADGPWASTSIVDIRIDVVTVGG